MRHHLISYVEENMEEVSDLVHNVLKERNMKFEEYLKLMKNEITCGYEATLLILAKMFGMKILVIRSDYLWLSESIKPINCDVVLVQNNCGLFYGTKGNKNFDVGVVPKICSPKHKVAESSICGDQKSKSVNTKTLSSVATGSPSNLASKNDINGTSTPKSVGQKNVFTFDLTFSPIEEKPNEVSGDVVNSKGANQKICPDVMPTPDNENAGAADDQKICTEMKRLGMSGPAQKLVIGIDKNPSVSVSNISKNMSGSRSVTVKKMNDCDKIIKFACPICGHRSFTINGFQYHMFSEHRRRRGENLSPIIIEGPDVSLSSDSTLPNIIPPSQ